MKKSISDFIGALAREYHRGDCVCFVAEKVVNYFLALEQADIDYFNNTLKEILESQEGIDKEFKEFKKVNENITHAMQRKYYQEGCFLQNRQDVEKQVKEKNYHLFTEPACSGVDSLIIRLIQIFS